MAFFGNIFTAEIIARIFYNADKKVRQEIINDQDILETNERDRISALCTRIRDKVSSNPFIRSVSVQAHARDTTQRDALFVFRYGNEIKIGLVEAKLLRIRNSKLNKSWDWEISKTDKNSHFTKQVINQQNWLNQAAVWEMFIPNCPIGIHTPPFEKYGSSNIWADETYKSSKISNPSELWTYQDVLDLKEEYLSLYDIIKAIMKCQKGIVHDVTGKSEIIIQNDNGTPMNIPIPRNNVDYFRRIRDFLSESKNIESYNYYRLDDVFESVKDYKEIKELFIPSGVRNKRSFNDESLSEYLGIVNDSFEVVKNDI
ncbi:MULTISPECIES: hypothetical protein [Flavobacterium]|uniref:Uncharacterized protein n=1 Tax=Flavobacterium algoritolerans TaxID=3041254 RepID=A0ABT6VAS5_9FLAO|nr:hypothetical protein [Flavobacterium algoritolerans]MDI5895348.1 hypothetical protein [Flavobacterium algoritolerans]